LAAGKTPKEILDAYYGGEPGRDLMAADLEAIRKYTDRDMIVPVKDDPAIVARVQRITNMILTNPRVTNGTMQKALGISQATIVHDLQRLPQSVIDVRILSGHNWCIGIERMQDEIIQRLHKKNKRPADVVAAVNAAMQRINPSLPQMTFHDYENRVKTMFGNQRTKFATGGSKFTRDQTAAQNAIIKTMALQKRRSPDIATEIKKQLGHDLTVDQIDARISYLRKRGIISVERNPVRSQFTRQQIDAQNARIRQLLLEGKRPVEIEKDPILQGLPLNSRLRRIQKIKSTLR
jgi:predicted HTH transcriptional regulator